MCYKNWKFAFLSDCRRGNVFSIWTGTQWIGSNCLWTFRYIEVWREHPRPIWSIVRDPALRCIDITRHSSHLNGLRNPVCHLIGNMLYSLRHLKVDNRKDASTPQTFTCIVLFHVSTKYLCHLTAASAAASDVLITRGSGYQCLSLVLSADKANVSSSREHYTITLDPDSQGSALQ